MNAAYKYPATQFAAARRALMAPLPQGDAIAFTEASVLCSLGLKDLDAGRLDESAGEWVRAIRRIMDTAGIEDPTGRGVVLLRAEQLTLEEMHELSTAIDELAHWFHERYLIHG